MGLRGFELQDLVWVCVGMLALSWSLLSLLVQACDTILPWVPGLNSESVAQVRVEKKSLVMVVEAMT